MFPAARWGHRPLLLPRQHQEMQQLMCYPKERRQFELCFAVGSSGLWLTGPVTMTIFLVEKEIERRVPYSKFSSTRQSEILNHKDIKIIK